MKKAILIIVTVCLFLGMVPTTGALPASTTTYPAWDAAPTGWTVTAGQVTTATAGQLNGTIGISTHDTLEYLDFKDTAVTPTGQYVLTVGFETFTVYHDGTKASVWQNGALQHQDVICTGTGLTLTSGGATSFKYRLAGGTWSAKVLANHAIDSWNGTAVTITNVNQTGSQQLYTFTISKHDTPHIVLESSYYAVAGNGTTNIPFSVEYDGVDAQGGYITFSALWRRNLYVPYTEKPDLLAGAQLSGGQLLDSQQPPGTTTSTAVAYFTGETFETRTIGTLSGGSWHWLLYDINETVDNCPYVNISLSQTTFIGPAPHKVNLTFHSEGQFFGDTTRINVSLLDQDRGLLDWFGDDLIDSDGDGDFDHNINTSDLGDGAGAALIGGTGLSDWELGAIAGGAGASFVAALVVLRSNWWNKRGRRRRG